ncbi:MAG: hypothetical protein LC797_13180 [Chloroflexi bacterium]|nr:hypothetical protein [Chloroflexota bacterium]
MRLLIPLAALALWLSWTGAAFAQADSDAESAPADLAPAEESLPPPDLAPAGPSLQASDLAPIVCDASTAGFRYVEVRGSGFDAWATQRLVGNLRDGNGTPRVQWGSVWVSPQGGLTLEVNLCADPFRGRPALAPGTYTVSVGAGSGAAIAATSIDVSLPPEPPAEGDLPAPDAAAPTGNPAPEGVPATNAANPAPEAAPGAAVNGTPVPFVVPNVVSAPAPAPTPLTLLATAPTPTPGPRTGPGSRQQPLPLGAPGLLADGWQLVVTGVTPDAWSGIHSAIPSSLAPAADQRDYLVRVQATYQGQGTGVFSAMRLALLSGIQTSYDQLHNGCGVVPDMVPPNLVTPGGEIRGNVCFTLRASDIDTLVLFDNQSNDGDKLYFALK